MVEDRGHIYHSGMGELDCHARDHDAYALKVSEELVLEDSVGLHLGAGPYLLLYSRALPEGAEPLDLQWPPPIKVYPVPANTEALILPLQIDRCREPQSCTIRAVAVLANGEQSSGRGERLDLSSGRPNGYCILTWMRGHKGNPVVQAAYYHY